jgi:hypothetical protein
MLQAISAPSLPDVDLGAESLVALILSMLGVNMRNMFTP